MESKMNDQVWDLIEQADEQGGDDPDIRDALLVELVVKEFKSVLLHMMNKGQGDSDTLDLALTEINEHFGVEDDE